MVATDIRGAAMLGIEVPEILQVRWSGWRLALGWIVILAVDVALWFLIWRAWRALPWIAQIIWGGFRSGAAIAPACMLLAVLIAFGGFWRQG